MNEGMKTILYVEPNEWPPSVIAYGTYPATWVGFMLLLGSSTPHAHVQTSHGFPGTVSCEVTFTAETVTVSVELAS